MLSVTQVTLRPGGPVEVVDLSPQGIQVESTRPLRPGSRVLARLAVGDQTMTVPAVVLRCAVWGYTRRRGLRIAPVSVSTSCAFRSGRSSRVDRVWRTRHRDQGRDLEPSAPLSSVARQGLAGCWVRRD